MEQIGILVLVGELLSWRSILKLLQYIKHLNAGSIDKLCDPTVFSL